RLLEDLADRAVALAAEVTQDRSGARRLAARLAQRLAHLARHLACDLLDARVDRFRDLHEQVAALRRRQPRPGGERLLRCADRVVDVAPVAGRKLAHDLVRMHRVALLVRVARARAAPLAGDVVPERDALRHQYTARPPE